MPTLVIGNSYKSVKEKMEALGIENPTAVDGLCKYFLRSFDINQHKNTTGLPCDIHRKVREAKFLNNIIKKKETLPDMYYVNRKAVFHHSSGVIPTIIPHKCDSIYQESLNGEWFLNSQPDDESLLWSVLGSQGITNINAFFRPPENNDRRIWELTQTPPDKNSITKIVEFLHKYQIQEKMGSIIDKVEVFLTEDSEMVLDVYFKHDMDAALNITFLGNEWMVEAYYNELDIVETVETQERLDELINTIFV